MSFLHTIKAEERRILRSIVKRVHMKHHPKDFVNDYEADKIISAIAPDVVERLMKVGKDMKIDSL
jgi:hypothetical protein